ncbi:hypothetical protein D1164_20470 [Mariniphaga sediminis]|uniref:Uncharacterized protein n=1 Tax=Mariniphaga sediminis TaxID=1628158 RepID=A0A399CY11_9BACT|nr:hypothetical protein D1164_20470 [Mariniphaga sediminis]
MKWGLGQSPKQVDNQSVVMNRVLQVKFFTSNSRCFVKFNHSLKVSFEKILGEDKSEPWPANSFQMLCFWFKLEQSVNSDYYFGTGKKLNGY